MPGTSVTVRHNTPGPETGSRRFCGRPGQRAVQAARAVQRHQPKLLAILRPMEAGRNETNRSRNQEWFEVWIEGPGRAAATKQLKTRAVGWVSADEVAATAAAEVWTKMKEGSEIRSPEAYAMSCIPRVVLDLQWGGRVRSRAKVPITESTTGDFSQPAPPPKEEPGLLDPRGPSLETILSAVQTSAADLAAQSDLDQIRGRIADWLALTPRVGDRDARFGEPFLQATALLYLLMFSIEPLHERFWPAGYPVPDSKAVTAEIHLAAALWLTDREWFPATSPTDTERRRAKRARDQLQTVARQLGLDPTEHEQ